MVAPKTLIRGSWVVGWDGSQHEVIRGGVCVTEGDTIAFVGKSYDGDYDRLIDATGCLVSPGLISTHLHAGFNARDYVYLDHGRPGAVGRNYLNWQAGLKDVPRFKSDPKASITFGLAQCLLGGITTVVEFGAGGDGETFVSTVDELGIRAYVGLSYRNAVMHSEPTGAIGYTWGDVDELFDQAVQFADELDKRAHTRLQPILCPGHPDTVELSVLERTSELASLRGWPVTIHAGLHLKEFERTYARYGLSPYQVLDRVGLLGPQVLLGHAMIHRRHSLSSYAGDDLELLAERNAVIAHSPIKFAHLGVVMESLQRYADAGITVTIATDMSPPDILSEMRFAMLGSRIADRDFLSGSPRLVFDAATVNAADALGRPDLGRLTPGAKADVVAFDLSNLRFGAIYDPIRSLVEIGTGADLRWSMVDGKLLVDNRQPLTVDVEDLLTKAQIDGNETWTDIPNWYPGGRSIDEIVPPAYPIR